MGNINWYQIQFIGENQGRIPINLELFVNDIQVRLLDLIESSSPSPLEPSSSGINPLRPDLSILYEFGLEEVNKNTKDGTMEYLKANVLRLA